MTCINKRSSPPPTQKLYIRHPPSPIQAAAPESRQALGKAGANVAAPLQHHLKINTDSHKIRGLAQHNRSSRRREDTCRNTCSPGAPACRPSPAAGDSLSTQQQSFPHQSALTHGRSSPHLTSAATPLPLPRLASESLAGWAEHSGRQRMVQQSQKTSCQWRRGAWQ